MAAGAIPLPLHTRSARALTPPQAAREAEAGSTARLHLAPGQGTLFPNLSGTKLSLCPQETLAEGAHLPTDFGLLCPLILSRRTQKQGRLRSQIQRDLERDTLRAKIVSP